MPFFLVSPPPPRSTLFPYTTLFRSRTTVDQFFDAGYRGRLDFASLDDFLTGTLSGGRAARGNSNRDRKSTRLNSSHVEISYAVFCLKKKMTSPPGSRVATSVDHGRL